MNLKNSARRITKMKNHYSFTALQTFLSSVSKYKQVEPKASISNMKGASHGKSQFIRPSQLQTIVEEFRKEDITPRKIQF